MSLPPHSSTEKPLRATAANLLTDDPRARSASAESGVGRGGVADIWREYWGGIRIRYRQILSLVAVGILVAVAATLLTPRTYTASSLIQIDREPNQVVRFEGQGTAIAANGDASEFYQTQYELLRSRALAQRVAARLEGVAPASALNALGNKLGSAWPSDRSGQVDALAGMVTVQPIRNSRLVKLNAVSVDAAFAAKVANAYADAYIESNLDHRVGASAYARDFLEKRLSEVKTKLESSERQLVEFAQAEQIVNGPDGQSLASQSMVELNASLAESSAQRARAEARWREVSGSGGVPGDMLQNSIVNTLRAKRAEVASEYSNKQAVFLPDHPELKRLAGELAEVDRQIRMQHESIRGSARADYMAAVNQERSIRRDLARARGEELDLQGRSIQYNILKREVDTNRQLYDGLLQQFKEVGVAGSAQNNNIAVIDPAREPVVPSKPSVRQNLVRGALVGLLLGIGLALMRHLLDDRMRDPVSIEEHFGLQLVGMVPAVKGPLRTMADDPRSVLSEAYRSVRTALQFVLPAGRPSATLITSSSPSEGKTVTSFMLARSFAELGQKVLVIDADLRKPALHTQFGLTNNLGLTDYLTGRKEFADTLSVTAHENLSVVTAGKMVGRGPELLASDRFTQFLAHAKQNYDQVIVDGPPVLGLADAPLLASAVDGVLLAFVPGTTRMKALSNGLRRLRASGARIIGAVATRYDRQAQIAYGGYDELAYYGYGEPGRGTDGARTEQS